MTKEHNSSLVVVKGIGRNLGILAHEQRWKYPAEWSLEQIAVNELFEGLKRPRTD